MNLLPGDYVLCGVTAILAGLGLFRGLSGVFAFAGGLAVGGASGVWGWFRLFLGIESPWGRGVAAMLLFVLAFGIVRWAVKYLVGKILSQPSDAIFGVCFGLFCSALIVWAVAVNADLRIHSHLAQKVYEHVGDSGVR